jgi:4-amino-4-deoxy-L-arabinose transferase-like glycosyltransferase
MPPEPAKERRLSDEPGTVVRDGADESAAPGGALRRLAASARAARVDIAIIAAITLLAAVLRLWHLGSVPAGLHGDEAWTGLDARRILREGWIGPYVGSALGQPTGPLYFTALLFKFMPETTFTVRFSMAIFGIATVPVMYLAFAAMFNRTVAAFSALLLTIMMWHLHLSRTGFMVTAWPFMEMLVLWLLWTAMRRRSGWLFVLAGAAHGLGVYSYNAYTLFLPVPFVAIAWWFFEQRTARQRRHWLSCTLIFGLTALLAAMPLIRYAQEHGHAYRAHENVVALTYQDSWREADALGKAEVIWDRAQEWQSGLIYGDRPDMGDGLATQGHPVVDPFVFLLAIGGLGIAAWRIREREYAVVLAAAALLPWGALLTVRDGLFRRTLGLAPFIALLAALVLASFWEYAWRKRDRWRHAATALVAAGLLFVGAHTVWQYFGPVQDSGRFRLVYPYQLEVASQYIDTLPPDTYIYFWSDRWPFDYETRRFFAPRVVGIDRSIEYREGAVESDPVDYGADPAQARIAFVFLGHYVEDIANVEAKYPGGQVTERMRGDEVLFRAYYVERPGD